MNHLVNTKPYPVRLLIRLRSYILVSFSTSKDSFIEPKNGREILKYNGSNPDIDLD